MVEERFQKRVMARLMIISLLGIFIMALIIYLLANEEIERTFFSIHQGVRNTWQALIPAIFLGGGLTLVTTTFAVYYTTLYQSHKIGGPIYRLRKVMEELEKGNYAPHVNVRSGDYMSFLAHSVERALSTNRQKISELKKEAAFIHKRIDDLRRFKQAGSDISVQDQISTLETSIGRVNELLDYFKIG